MKWTIIWESEPYQAAIYDNCTIRVYEGVTDPTKIKVEQDTTKWVGNTGGFDVAKSYYDGNRAAEIKRWVGKYDNDEANEDDVIIELGLHSYYTGH